MKKNTALFAFTHGTYNNWRWDERSPFVVTSRSVQSRYMIYLSKSICFWGIHIEKSNLSIRLRVHRNCCSWFLYKNTNQTQSRTINAILFRLGGGWFTFVCRSFPVGIRTFWLCCTSSSLSYIASMYLHRVSTIEITVTEYWLEERIVPLCPT